MDKSIFSQNLVRARNEKGWSQEGAAAAIRESGVYNFTRSTLGAMEEGRVKTVKYHIQKAIEKAYGISNFERFMNDPTFFDSPVSGYELERKYRQLSSKEKKIVDMLLGLC